MKLDPLLLPVLKNFVKINPNIIFEKGNIVKTISPHSKVFATATLQESFPVEFGIYDLKQFINIIDLHRAHDVEFTFNEHSVTIASKLGKVNYMFAETSVLTSFKSARNKNVKLPSCDATFKLTKNDLDAVISFAATLNLEHLVFSWDGNDLTVKTYDIKNDTSNVFEKQIEGIQTTLQAFTVVLDISVLDLLPDDYVVNISKSKLVQFEGQFASYIVVCEAKKSEII